MLSTFFTDSLLTVQVDKLAKLPPTDSNFLTRSLEVIAIPQELKIFCMTSSNGAESSVEALTFPKQDGVLTFRDFIWQRLNAGYNSQFTVYVNVLT